MTPHELADELSEKQTNNVLNSWDEESKKYKDCMTLIRLGDSKKLAVATVMLEKECDVEFYHNAYRN